MFLSEMLTCFVGETRKCPHAGFSQRHPGTRGALPSGPQASSAGRNGRECGRRVCSWDRLPRPVGCWLLPSLKGWVVTSIVELREGRLDVLWLISWVSVLTRLRVWCWRMRRNRGLGCFRSFLPFSIITFLAMDHLQATQSLNVSSSVTRWIELSTRDSGTVAGAFIFPPWTHLAGATDVEGLSGCGHSCKLPAVDMQWSAPESPTWGGEGLCVGVWAPSLPPCISRNSYAFQGEAGVCETAHRSLAVDNKHRKHTLHSYDALLFSKIIQQRFILMKCTAWSLQSPCSELTLLH